MFTPPARAGRIRAVGPVAGLPPMLRRAFDEQGSDPARSESGQPVPAGMIGVADGDLNGSPAGHLRGPWPGQRPTFFNCGR
ncbi:MAG TPA: hypothetical protein DHU96_09830 [Actinobacteria bacterium]|nr:hypothetical protein [Actinomycetota bacterium]